VRVQQDRSSGQKPPLFCQAVGRINENKNMTIFERFIRLSFWNKFAAVSGGVTIVGFVLGILFYLSH
jgi:hypothetical protein